MMGEITTRKLRPDWDRLYETAAGQEGYFSTAQAKAAGYSPQLLARHMGNGRIARARRGIYRLTHFPAGEHEELVVVWLWSERAGVFSHETALFLHGLSDALPSRVHLTLPAAWRSRRLRVPKGVATHFSDIAEQETSLGGSRTCVQCLANAPRLRAGQGSARTRARRPGAGCRARVDPPGLPAGGRYLSLPLLFRR